MLSYLLYWRDLMIDQKAEIHIFISLIDEINKCLKFWCISII
jgi:hypothetical protein